MRLVRFVHIHVRAYASFERLGFMFCSSSLKSRCIRRKKDAYALFLWRTPIWAENRFHSYFVLFALNVIFIIFPYLFYLH